MPQKCFCHDKHSCLKAKHKLYSNLYFTYSCLGAGLHPSATATMKKKIKIKT